MPHRDPAKRREYIKKYRAEHPEYVQRDIEKQKARLEANPEIRAKKLARQAERLKNDPEYANRRRKQWREWRQANYERVAPKAEGNRYFKRYGITYEQRDELIKKQENKCAICKGELPLHTDHCHKTGKVRGMLCSNCNTLLGLSGDNASVLRAAAEYLEWHST